MRGSGRALALVQAAVLFSTVADAGIRWDWTPAEKDCAQRQGVTLGGANLGARAFVRYLTWLSDVAVRGVVIGVRHDLTEGFPTIAKLEVQAVLKGTGVPPVLEIVSSSGPVGSTADGETIEVHSGDPTYEVGEKLYVFLTGGTYHTSGGERALPAHQFAVVDAGKWTIQEDGTASYGWACATSDENTCGPQWNARVEWIEKQIEKVRIAQETLCR